MEERKTRVNEGNLRIVPRIGYYLKSRNIADIFKDKYPIFAAGGDARRIDLFSNSLEYMGSLRGHQESIMCLCAFPNKILASGSMDKNIKIWDIKERRRILISTLSGHKSNVTALCYVREGVFVSGSMDKSLIIWSKQPESSYIYLHRLTGHKTYIRGIIRVNNEVIMAGEWNGDFRTWNIDLGGFLRHIRVFRDSIYQMKQGIGEEVVVSYKKQVNVWKVPDFREHPLKHFRVCDGESIELLSGDLLLRGGDNGELQFINYREGGCTRLIPLHNASIRCIQRIVTNLVVTASADEYLKVFDPISGKCHMKYRKYNYTMSAIAYFN